MDAMAEGKGVKATHPDYDEYYPRWALTKNVVRSRVKEYIKDVEDESGMTEDRMPRGLSKEQQTDYMKHWWRMQYAASCRNERYRDDAQFVNFTAHHKNFLLGALFREEPVTTLPSEIEYLKDNATGSGQSLARLAQEIAGEIIQTGRYGLLVDYPASEEGLTQSQVQELELKASICKYPAESIINWQTENYYGVETLALVVLEENISLIGEDGFTWENKTVYRVLRLINGEYIQYMYNEKNEIISQYSPRDKDGNPWDEIPFVFIGSENNDANVDSSPLYDIAKLNIGHLVNSADYEESIHISGTPSIFITTEMSGEEFERANPGGIKIGSRRGHNLGPNSRAEFIQAAPNGIVREAMLHKESQIYLMGVRPVIPGGSNETVMAVKMRLTGETCEMNIWANNISEALEQAAYWALKFVGDIATAEEIEIELNEDFIGLDLDSNQINALIVLRNNGVISTKIFRKLLRSSGYIPEEIEDEDIDESIRLEVDATNPFGGGGSMFTPAPVTTIAEPVDEMAE